MIILAAVALHLAGQSLDIEQRRAEVIRQTNLLQSITQSGFRRGLPLPGRTDLSEAEKREQVFFEGIPQEVQNATERHLISLLQPNVRPVRTSEAMFRVDANLFGTKLFYGASFTVGTDKLLWINVRTQSWLLVEPAERPGQGPDAIRRFVSDKAIQLLAFGEDLPRPTVSVSVWVRSKVIWSGSITTPIRIDGVKIAKPRWDEHVRYRLVDGNIVFGFNFLD